MLGSASETVSGSADAWGRAERERKEAVERSKRNEAAAAGFCKCSRHKAAISATAGNSVLVVQFVTGDEDDATVKLGAVLDEQEVF